MTLAWYGHLKYRKSPLIAAIVVSWLIAFFEYLLPGAGESHRVRRVHRVPTEDYSGSDHFVRLRSLRLLLFGRGPELELRRLVSLHHRRGRVCLLGQVLES